MAKTPNSAMRDNRRSSRKSKTISKNFHRFRLSFEALEQRQLLSVNPVISEFMASNSTTLKDYYGKYSDWLEIYNPDTVTLDLSGWKLKDNSTLWTMPASVTIPAQGYLTVFCDSRDTIAPNGELHTNFKLGASGDYLGLLKPDNTVVSQYSLKYPQQYTDISYGLAMEPVISTPITSGTSGKWNVPTAALPSNWNSTSYSDAAWTSSTMPLGYDLPAAGGNYSYGQYGTNNTWNLYEVVNTAASWADAYNAARAKSVAGVTGHLVTIGSSGELNFAKNKFTSSSWTGLTDDPAYGGTEKGNTSSWPAPTEGQPPTATQRGAGFVWCNGESFNYHNNVWASGQPGGDGNYVRMGTSGSWDDRNNTYTYPYLIEYDLNLSAQPSAANVTSNANGFSVIEKHSTSDLPDINTAVDFLNNGTGTTYAYSAAVINYSDPEDPGGGDFSGDSPFGGNTSNDDDLFVLRVRGTVHIPTAGAWTFGVASDDGFRLRLTGATFNTLTNCSNAAGTDTIEFAGLRGADNSLGAINNLAAGNYEFELISFENYGGSSLEFFAAPGAKTAFDSNFKLVGDAANGGLSLLQEGDILGSNLRPAFEAASFGKNASAFLRVPFNVANASLIDSLTLRMKYDDGFVAYLNGVEVARANAPSTLAWNSASTADHYTGDAVRYEDFDISDFKGNLASGANVLAFQLLNSSAADSNVLLLPELVMISQPVITTNVRYFAIPTPGHVNGVGTSDLGPMVTEVSIPAVQPGDGDNIVVTAKVQKTISNIATATVTLHYRVMYGTEYTVTMLDNGSSGDGAASDGVYGATIPASASLPGQMVRWYVTAADTNGRTGRWPIMVPIVGDDGGPEYEGTVIANPSVTSTLPIIQTFTTDFSAADSLGGIRGSVFYLGEFYDNVFIRHRGGYTTNGNKIEFNSGYDFKFAEDQARVKEINLNQQGWDDSYARPTVAFETMRDAGVAASIVFPMRVQRNNQYFRVMSFLEQFDKNLLKREGIYENGAIYKSYTDVMDSAYGFEKKNRDEVPGNDDLQQFLNGLHLADSTARRNFIYDNVDIPAMLDYLAANVLFLDNDQVAKNYYIYCDTNDGVGSIYGDANPKGTNEWTMAPWDKDLTFGKDYGFEDYQIPDPYAHPFFSDSDHPKVDGPVNWMVDVMLDIPEIKQMYLRRLRTLMDEYLQPPGTPVSDRFYEQRFNELFAKLMGDPVVVSQVGDLSSYYNDIKTKYLDPRRTHLYVDHCTNTSYPDYAGIPAEQAENLAVNFGTYEVSPASGNQDQEYLTLVNPNSFAMDISGWKLTGGINLTFKKGIVIPAGGTLYVSPNVYAFRQRSSGPSGNQGLLVEGNYDGHLSKWGEAVQLLNLADTVVATLTTSSNPSLAQQYLRITEIMYHPADPPSGSYINDDFQFIELKNTSTSQTLSLSGVRFTEGVTFDFTGSNVTSLAPGTRVLVVSNLAAFQSRYGTGLDGIIAGQFSKANPADLSTTHLAKSGEKVTLVDSVGETILSFSYQDDWYKQTDGSGNSLVIRDAAAADRELWGRHEGWFASHAANGSPGTDETTAIAADAIVVNELLSHRTDEPGAMGDWVEFYNTTAAPINIGGWYLSNDDANLKKFQIATDTLIPAHGYKAFNWRDNFGSTANQGCITPFTLGELGGTVYLTSALSSALTDFQASETFGSSDTGVTLGRYIKCTGGKDFVAMTSPTYEAANAAPAVGPVVINEIYYHPTAGKDSFIELKNITGQAVMFYDPARPQNTWHLAEGVEFTFPAGATISAGGYALVVNIDPTYFRAKYGISASVPIFGPYLYELSNSGDTVEVKYPDDPQPDGKVPYDRMDQITFEDGGLWSKSADGFGASLNRVSAAGYGNDAANWTAGQPTPGAENATISPAPIIVAAVDWIAAGTSNMTLKYAADGKLHIYKTGTTIDIVPPQPPAWVSSIDVTGRNLLDIFTVESMGTGVPIFAIHNVAAVLSQNNAILSGTSVTIDAGTLNFNGHSDNIGNLVITNNGQALVTAIANNATTVESGTLTATSIICDTLAIGSTSAAAGNSSMNQTVASGAAIEKNASESSAVASVDEQASSSEIISPNSSVPTGDVSGNSSAFYSVDAIVAVVSYESPIPVEENPVVPTLRANAFGFLATNAVAAVPQLPHEKPVFSAISANSVEDLWPKSAPEKLIVTKQEAIVIANNIVNCFPVSTNQEQLTRYAALHSVIHEYHDLNTDGYAEYGYIHHKQAAKHNSRSEKAVDIVLALDANFGTDRSD